MDLTVISAYLPHVRLPKLLQCTDVACYLNSTSASAHNLRRSTWEYRHIAAVMQVMRIPFTFMQAHHWRNGDSVINDLGTNVHLTPPAYIPRPHRVAAPNAVVMSIPTNYDEWAALINRELLQHSRALHPDRAVLQLKWQLVVIAIAIRLLIGKWHPFIAFEFMDIIFKNLVMTAYLGTFTKKLSLPFSTIETARLFFVDNNDAVLGTVAPRPSWISYRKFPLPQVRDFENYRNLASAISRNKLITAIGLDYQVSLDLWIRAGRHANLLPYRLADPVAYEVIFCAKNYTHKEKVTLGLLALNEAGFSYAKLAKETGSVEEHLLSAQGVAADSMMMDFDAVVSDTSRLGVMVMISIGMFVLELARLPWRALSIHIL